MAQTVLDVQSGVISSSSTRNVGQRIFDPNLPPNQLLDWEQPQPNQVSRACTECGMQKNLETSFHRNGRNKHGLDRYASTCKRCVSRARYSDKNNANAPTTGPDNNKSIREDIETTFKNDRGPILGSTISRFVSAPLYFQSGFRVFNTASVAFFDLSDPTMVEIVLNVAEINSNPPSHVHPMSFIVEDTAERQEASLLRQLIPLLTRGSEEGLLEENRELLLRLAEERVAREKIERQLQDLLSRMAAMMDAFRA